MVCRSVMKEMIFIAPPQRGQIRGSTSLMWRIRFAQRFLAALRSAESGSLATGSLDGSAPTPPACASLGLHWRIFHSSE